jgi:release factor glutamine methyltransferase
MQKIYEPAEDSFLLSETLGEKIPNLLEKNSDLKLLEIGSGSGINLKTALSLGIKKENIFSCDISFEAVEHCKKLCFNCVESDLFENFEENAKFDLIIFNPPYLPADKNEPEKSKLETTGGKRGNEISLKFLKQSKNHLEENGKIFLITSSLAKEINFEKLGWKSEKIGGKKLFFEELVVWGLERNHNNV